MKRFFALFLALIALFASPLRAANAGGEYVIVVGGPSLQQWEKYKAAPHDHWWANFVHSARVRTEQLRAEHGDDAPITWLVYKQGYIDRAPQEKQDLIANINSIRDKFHLNLVWFRNGDDVIDYLNNGQPRDSMKVAGFEYFGHSNKACFMFDYSSNVDSASKSFLRDVDLVRINRRVFAHNPEVKSWGCHTGERMSDYWRKATGTRMVGAIGKTDFSTGELPALSSPGGKWVN
ncbi:MAG: hypothetical protein M3Z64_08570 [Verrucomicrobiota bacterium]|nr:hypothetical protein [Verrucomicrobiota bacterium]